MNPFMNVNKSKITVFKLSGLSTKCCATVSNKILASNSAFI